MKMGSDSDKEDRKERKARMKEEADKLGISYDELKRRNKKHKREAESLESPEHKKEIGRMRSWSKDEKDKSNSKSGTQDRVAEEDEPAAKRRRTRSMDAAEEKKALEEDESNMDPEEWRKEHSITIQGHGANRNREVPKPFFTFQQTPFHANIQRAFQQAGFSKPTAIQSQAWPISIERKDMICIAKTGSGKTCGFLLPSFHQHLQEQPGGAPNFGRGRGKVNPVLLVLAPTRELSVQIMEECQKFGRSIGMRSVCCYGGSAKYPQIAALERGVEVVIATPGRLNDLLEMKKADLSNIKYLVLDEADRMLDMVREHISKTEICDIFKNLIFFSSPLAPTGF